MSNLNLDWPFNPSATTDEFGWRTLSGKPNHHNGLDFWFSGIDGDPVRSVGDGTVVEVFVNDRELGNAVRIRHQNSPRVSTGYLHLKAAPTVKVGQKVKRGQTIGYVGNTGLSFGSHLHFECWEGTTANNAVRVNPRDFMTRHGSGRIVSAGSAAGTPKPISGTPLKLKQAWWTYKTAADARSLRNKQRTIPAGNYTITKRDGNAVQLADSKGRNKGWVHGSVAGGPAPAKPKPTVRTLRLRQSWYYYWTATNANALRGWSRSRMLAPGTYSVVAVAKNGSIQLKSRFGNVWVHKSAG